MSSRVKPSLDFESDLSSKAKISEVATLNAEDFKILEKAIHNLVEDHLEDCKVKPRRLDRGRYQQLLAEFVKENAGKIWSKTRDGYDPKGSFSWPTDKESIEFLCFQFIRYEAARCLSKVLKRKESSNDDQTPSSASLATPTTPMTKKPRLGSVPKTPSTPKKALSVAKKHLFIPQKKNTAKTPVSENGKEDPNESDSASSDDDDFDGDTITLDVGTKIVKVKHYPNDPFTKLRNAYIQAQSGEKEEDGTKVATSSKGSKAKPTIKAPSVTLAMTPNPPPEASTSTQHGPEVATTAHHDATDNVTNSPPAAPTIPTPNPPTHTSDAPSLTSGSSAFSTASSTSTNPFPFHPPTAQPTPRQGLPLIFHVTVKPNPGPQHGPYYLPGTFATTYVAFRASVATALGLGDAHVLDRMATVEVLAGGRSMGSIFLVFPPVMMQYVWAHVLGLVLASGGVLMVEVEFTE